ncbi:MAG: thiamine-phosphate kinase [Thermodesulfovibrionia bacterium]
MRLSRIGEFGLIKRIERLCKKGSKGLIVGMGDDCAVIKPTNGFTLITSDMLIEGIHFDLKYTDLYQLGYKAIAVNISDVLAMGGMPRFFMLDIGIPEGFDSKDIEEIYEGITELAERFGVRIIGGDTSLSLNGLLLSGILIGEAERPIMRKGARVGDGIFVTGMLGDSAMGLELLRMGERLHSRQRPSISYLIKRHLTPEPCAVINTNGITSMIDISDGLLIDLSHICDESGVGAMIYKGCIPLSDELISVANGLNKDPYQFALRGGEDYVLLFTSHQDRRDAIRIGEIIRKGRYIIDEKGRRVPFKSEGYEHFKDSELGTSDNRHTGHRQRMSESLSS